MSLKDLETSDYLRIFGGAACLLLAVGLVFSKGGSSGANQSSDKTSLIEGVKTISGSEATTVGQIINEQLTPQSIVDSKPNNSDILEPDDSSALDEITGVDDILTNEVRDLGAEAKEILEPTKTKQEAIEEFNQDLARAKIELKLDIEEIKKREKAYLDTYPPEQSYVKGQAEERKDLVVKNDQGPFGDIVSKVEQAKPTQSQIDHKRIIKGLVERLYDADSYKVASAALTLRTQAEEADIEAISKVLKLGPPVEVKKYLIETLGAIGSPKAITALEFELQHGENAILPLVIDALGRTRSDKAIPILASIMRGLSLIHI